MTAPRLSVLTAVFNGQRFLDEAVESVLTQDFRDFEYLLVDDGSTDRTAEILAAWAARDPRVVLLRNSANAGHSASLNRALRAARGTWIARQDADDLSEPGRFSRQMAFADDHPDVVLISTDYRVVDERGALLRSDRRSDRREVVEYFLRFGNILGGHTQVLFRRDDALAVAGYEESYRVSEDYDLWTRLAARGGVVIIPFFGMRYRLHAESASRAATREDRMTGVRIVQRELGGFLGRAVGEREALAVRIVSGAQFQLLDDRFSRFVPDAHRLFREAEARLAGQGASGEVRKRVRRRTAQRFAESAVLALAHREPWGAVRSLLVALRWNPWEAIAASASMVVRELGVRRRVRASARQRP